MHFEGALLVVVRQSELDVARHRELAETRVARVTVHAGNALLARLHNTPQQALGHGSPGHRSWVEWVAVLDGSPGSRVNVRSPMTDECLFEHTFVIVDQPEKVR